MIESALNKNTLEIPSWEKRAPLLKYYKLLAGGARFKVFEAFVGTLCSFQDNKLLAQY